MHVRSHTYSKCSVKRWKPQRANQMVGASWKSSNRNIPVCLWPVAHEYRAFFTKLIPKIQITLSRFRAWRGLRTQHTYEYETCSVYTLGGGGRAGGRGHTHTWATQVKTRAVAHWWLLSDFYSQVLQCSFWLHRHISVFFFSLVLPSFSGRFGIGPRGPFSKQTEGFMFPSPANIISKLFLAQTLT